MLGPICEIFSRVVKGNFNENVSFQIVHLEHKILEDLELALTKIQISLHFAKRNIPSC